MSGPGAPQTQPVAGDVKLVEHPLSTLRAGSVNHGTHSLLTLLLLTLVAACGGPKAQLSPLPPWVSQWPSSNPVAVATPLDGGDALIASGRAAVLELRGPRLIVHHLGEGIEVVDTFEACGGVMALAHDAEGVALRQVTPERHTLWSRGLRRVGEVMALPADDGVMVVDTVTQQRIQLACDGTHEKPRNYRLGPLRCERWSGGRRCPGPAQLTGLGLTGAFAPRFLSDDGQSLQWLTPGEGYLLVSVLPHDAYDASRFVVPLSTGWWVAGRGDIASERVEWLTMRVSRGVSYGGSAYLYATASSRDGLWRRLGDQVDKMVVDAAGEACVQRRWNIVWGAEGADTWRLSNAVWADLTHASPRWVVWNGLGMLWVAGWSTTTDGAPVMVRIDTVSGEQEVLPVPEATEVPVPASGCHARWNVGDPHDQFTDGEAR
jgi:hypothetical protein